MTSKIKSNFKNKKGFTLAEVLITLVIVGVIAAMTIPTLINKYKDEELKSQFRKAYSTITQAIYKTEMNDFYGYARCYTHGELGQNVEECGAFFDALAKNLHVQKVCRGNAKADGCVPTYTHTIQEACEGLTVNTIENRSRVYVLNDGQLIITYSDYCFAHFMVDINGQKGPNLLGIDLFQFTMQRDRNTGIYTNKATKCYWNPQAGYGKGRTTQQMIQYAFGGKK